MKKSQNGYYKFYSKDGTECRIKADRDIQGKVIIKFKYANSVGWRWYAPSREFKNVLDATTYILKNLESDKMVFKVIVANDLHKRGTK